MLIILLVSSLLAPSATWQNTGPKQRKWAAPPPPPPRFGFRVLKKKLFLVCFPLHGYGNHRSVLRPVPPRSPARGVCAGVLQARGVYGAGRRSLFWHGTNYHHPVDLPDTKGLCWREGILRCLESVLHWARTSPSSSPSAVPQSSLSADPQSRPPPSAAHRPPLTQARRLLLHQACRQPNSQPSSEPQSSLPCRLQPQSSLPCQLPPLSTLQCQLLESALLCLLLQSALQCQLLVSASYTPFPPAGNRC